MKRKSILILLIAVTSLIVSAKTNEVTVDGLKFLLNEDKTAIVSGYDSLPASGNIIFPATITVSGNTYEVVRIGRSAFEESEGLRNVEIPGSIKVIDPLAFHRAGSISSLKLANGIDSIYWCAFSNIESLKSVDIPASVRHFTGAFTPGLRHLIGTIYLKDYFVETINVSADNPNFKYSDGVLYNADMTELVYYPPTRKVSRFEMPESVKKVDGGAIVGATIDTLLVSPNAKEFSFWLCNVKDYVVVPGTIDDTQIILETKSSEYNYTVGRAVLLSTEITEIVGSWQEAREKAFGGYSTNLMVAPEVRKWLWYTPRRFVIAYGGESLYDIDVSAKGDKAILSFSNFIYDVASVDSVKCNGYMFDNEGGGVFSLAGKLSASKRYDVTIYLKILGSSYSYPLYSSITTPSNLHLGVDSVEFDSENECEPEYYNLQGLRIAEPAKGQIVVVRRGSKVTKEVYVR